MKGSQPPVAISVWNSATITGRLMLSSPASVVTMKVASAATDSAHQR